MQGKLGFWDVFAMAARSTKPLEVGQNVEPGPSVLAAASGT